MGSSILLGVLSTLILIIYAALATSAEDLFWSLFSAGAVIFLMPYVGMYLAFVGLRAKYPERERPFRIPGPECVGNLLAIACAAMVGLSVVLLIWSPVDGFKLPVIAGFAVSVIIGEVIVARAERRVRQ
jgi:amino acid transporter